MPKQKTHTAARPTIAELEQQGFLSAADVAAIRAGAHAADPSQHSLEMHALAAVCGALEDRLMNGGTIDDDALGLAIAATVLSQRARSAVTG